MDIVKRIADLIGEQLDSGINDVTKTSIVTSIMQENKYDPMFKKQYVAMVKKQVDKSFGDACRSVAMSRERPYHYTSQAWYKSDMTVPTNAGEAEPYIVLFGNKRAKGKAAGARFVSDDTDVMYITSKKREVITVVKATATRENNLVKEVGWGYLPKPDQQKHLEYLQ